MLEKTDKTTIQERLNRLTNTLRERGTSLLGYPVATDYDLADIAAFSGMFLNNIGDPDGVSMCGLNTHDMEREVLDFYKAHLGMDPDTTWGYVTSGSTEGNLYGLFAARQRFSDAAVYYSQASHYSIAKNIAILNMTGIPVNAQPSGEIDYDDLRQKLKANKHRAAVIVANIGTTMTEAKDNPEMIRRRAAEAGVADLHIHCDGALAGVYAKYTDPVFAKLGDYVDTITTSPYKFLGLPQPCGVVLVKKSLHANAGYVPYIESPDVTISGSRSGHTPLMIWYRLKHLGEEGIRRRYHASTALAEHTARALKEIGWQAWRNPGSLTVMLAAPPEHIIRKWQLATNDGWSHIMCMPGVSRGQIDRFVLELSQASQP